MPRKQLASAAIGLVLALAAGGPVAAEQDGKVPVYKPPLRGAPASRVSGGSRGIGDETPRLAVLVPDHTGLTTQEQPTLYWYITQPVPTRLEITVINEQSIQPLLEKKLDTPASAGIQKLSLKDFGLSLKQGIEYRWFVGLVKDPQQRSSDIIASGTIQLTPPTQNLKDKLARAERKHIPFVYAEEGYWYDALDAISGLITAHPDDRELHAQRAALLEQAGLEEAAKFDR
ncbi:MAG: DUF928 domain-containing protein [Sulfuricella denitrificans]|nr:DUF928 domain-containing protein [Sulfuricella denitrificans]